jgi:threonine dehydrogenase-like Zn-dependent dehydrogenase
MKAACWMGTRKVAVQDVPDPQLLNSRDAIIKITSTAICGSDLHLYNGFIPTMKKGDVVGHEFMGEVVELGRDVTNLAVGDRVVVPFPLACGRCEQCQREMYSLCENSNPNAWMAEKMWGYSPCGIFGYSHMLGGFAGGQAEYARVPFADIGPIKVPDELEDDQVLFLSDIFPTGYMAAEMCGIQPGDVVAVWGCGPVGQFAIKSAYMLGAERVIAIDRFDYRLKVARDAGGAETLNYEHVDVRDALEEMTGGRGPDHCIDAVGMEAHAPGLAFAYDKLKTNVFMETDRPIALRQAILSCRSGGTISVAGVYGGFVDKFPMGAIVNRSLTIRSGQCHVHRYLRPLLERIRQGHIDPRFIISHHLPLEQASDAYEMFGKKEDECLKVVLRPGSAANGGARA